MQLKAFLVAVLATLSVGAPVAMASERGIELVSEPGSAPYEPRFFSIDPDGSGVYYTVAADTASPAGARQDSVGPDDFGAFRGESGWENRWLTPYCPGWSYMFAPGASCSGLEGGTSIVAAGQGETIFGSFDGIPATKPHPGLLEQMMQTTSYDLYQGTPDGVAILSRPADTPAWGAFPSGAYTEGGPPKQVATSADMSTVAYLSQDHLLPEAAGLSGPLVYVVRDGERELASAPAPGAGGGCAGECEALFFAQAQANSFSVKEIGLTRAASAGGEQIFFTTNRQLDPDVAAGDWHVYAYDGQQARLLTDGFNPPSPAANVRRRMSWASADGRYAFVMAIADAFFQSDGRIARVDTETGSVDEITPDGVAGTFVWASEDGSTAVFRSTSQLADAPAGANDKLYVWRAGQGVSYVSTAVGANTLTSNQAIERDIRGTPDGSTIVFATRGQLLPDDTNAVADIYRLEGDGLTLLTPRTGAAAASDIIFGRRPDTIVAETHPYYPVGITDDASEVYFATTSPLALEDTDGDRRDVYMWSDDGIELVTPPGSIPFHADLADHTRDGRDVFFMTDESLVPSDLDAGEIDIYNARRGGAFGDQHSSDPPCDGDACQGPPDAAPAAPPLGSATTRSFGNVATPRPARPTLAATVRASRPSRALLRLRTSRAGRIVVRGNRVRTVRRAVAAGPSQVVVRLRPTAARRLARSGARRVRLRVQIAFRANGGATVRRTLAVTVRTAGAGRGRAAR